MERRFSGALRKKAFDVVGDRFTCGNHKGKSIEDDAVFCHLTKTVTSSRQIKCYSNSIIPMIQPTVCCTTTHKASSRTPTDLEAE